MSSLSFTTAPMDFPAGTELSGYSVHIVNVAGTTVNSQVVTSTSATFMVSVGTYTASINALDASGTPIGFPANSAPFTVTEDEAMVTLQMPFVVTLTP